MKSGFVYIMSNHTRTTLYIGVTANLKKRIAEHKNGVGSKFTAQYKCYYLVYYEQHPTIEAAILRETQMKRWNRAWKDELIQSINPNLADLWDEL